MQNHSEYTITHLLFIYNMIMRIIISYIYTILHLCTYTYIPVFTDAYAYTFTYAHMNASMHPYMMDQHRINNIPNPFATETSQVSAWPWRAQRRCAERFQEGRTLDAGSIWSPGFHLL